MSENRNNKEESTAPSENHSLETPHAHASANGKETPAPQETTRFQKKGVDYVWKDGKLYAEVSGKMIFKANVLKEDLHQFTYAVPGPSDPQS